MNRKIWLTVSIVVVAIVLIASSARAQMMAYLKVGSINGNVTTTGYENWCDLLSYNLSVVRPEGGPPSFSDMYITRAVDSASPYFFGSAVIGQVYSDARLNVVKWDEDHFEDYVKWTLTNAVIRSYSTAFDSGQMLELIAIDYDVLTYEQLLSGERWSWAGFTYNRTNGLFDWLGTPPTDMAVLFQFTSEVIPEPTTTVLVGFVVAAFGTHLRRRFVADGAVNASMA